jgi:hypothetical protein
MFEQGVRFTIGWANIPTLMPTVIQLLARRSISLEPIHTIAPWEDAIDALRDPPTKLILAREEVMVPLTGAG